MLNRLEMLFTVCALLFCAGAFVSLTNQGPQVPDERPQSSVIARVQMQSRNESRDPTNANPAMLAVQICMYGVVAFLLLVHRHEALQLALGTKIIWAIVALAFVSVLWSAVPGFAFRRCLNMTASSGFGLYLACRYSQRRLLKLLGWAVMVALVCSVLIVFARPDLGIGSADTDYGWKGIFVQKNTLARFMALGFFVFLFLAFDSKRHRYMYSALSILCACVIYAAHSVTSALAIPILLGLIWFFSLVRSRPFWRIFAPAVFAGTGIACALVLFADPSALFSLVGRDATMSGRLEIWSAVTPKIMAHPWLGYGYGSFWLGMGGQASADVWSLLRWQVPHSHNGFLDLAEELGIVGLGVFLAGFLVSMKRGLTWARSHRTTIGLWPLAFLSFMFLFNLSEGSILRQDNIFWVLYIATSVFVISRTEKLAPEPLQAPIKPIGAPATLGYAPLGGVGGNTGMQASK